MYTFSLKHFFDIYYVFRFFLGVFFFFIYFSLYLFLMMTLQTRSTHRQLQAVRTTCRLAKVEGWVFPLWGVDSFKCKFLLLSSFHLLLPSSNWGFYVLHVLKFVVFIYWLFFFFFLLSGSAIVCWKKRWCRWWLICCLPMTLHLRYVRLVCVCSYFRVDNFVWIY